MKLHILIMFNYLLYIVTLTNHPKMQLLGILKKMMEKIDEEVAHNLFSLTISSHFPLNRPIYLKLSSLNLSALIHSCHLWL